MNTNKTDTYRYISGFGSYISSEALEGALPDAQNSPQVCPYGLYAEQLSGTAFTAPRGKNEKAWLYRLRPSACTSGPFQRTDIDFSLDKMVIDPNPMRWNPPSMPDSGLNFLRGLQPVCGSGDTSSKQGLCVYTYTASESMKDCGMYNADGDFLIVPQVGRLNIITEMGRLMVEPCEIVVIPRGIRFSVRLVDNEPIRGYILEVFEGHFELPGLGPIGANGLANERDFLMPTAWYEDCDNTSDPSYSFQLFSKYLGNIFEVKLNHSPFDVVGWHGNYYPFKYDLRKFNCINTVSYDHPDPSIYTVLTCPSAEPGVAVADFVIFPPRWMVAEHTFRPPYFHRNCMSEYMGMIYGKYDAKEDGFVPGGASLHSCMTPHGPDTTTFIKAFSVKELKPIYLDAGLAFMFESKYMMKIHPSALTTARQLDYWKCWEDMPKLFTGQKHV